MKSRRIPPEYAIVYEKRNIKFQHKGKTGWCIKENEGKLTYEKVRELYDKIKYISTAPSHKVKFYTLVGEGDNLTSKQLSGRRIGNSDYVTTRYKKSHNYICYHYPSGLELGFKPMIYEDVVKTLCVNLFSIEKYISLYWKRQNKRYMIINKEKGENL